ncbi:MAG TPA: putative lipid II flippase FtsW [Verrucomicrobiae bacterium]
MRLAVTILAFCVAGLLALGMVMLYSSSMVQSGTRYLLMQLLWCGLGLVVCAVVAACDYRHLKRVWWLLLGGAVVLLVLVLIPGIGSERNGARRWFSHFGLSFQPSEFAKLALMVALAWYGERYRRHMSSWARGILIPGVLIGVVTGLIFKEPDVGNALVLAAVGGCMLLLAGIRLRYFVPPAIIAAVAVGFFIYHNPMRSERIYAWLHLEETRQSKGMQGYEAMLALGSGGITGKGLGDSSQNGFLPFHHTDFIFAIIGEELGLVATLLVTAAFAAILACGLFIALRAPDTFGLLLGAGVIFLISLQALVNIGVVTSALPNKGLPLPFISYGGSNLLLMLTLVGLVLSIARHSQEPASLAATAEEAGSENPFARRKTAPA